MSKKESKRKSQKRSQKGGAGAADYALMVYGSGSEQHAQPGGNIIAAKAIDCIPGAQTGGSSKEDKKDKDLAEIKLKLDKVLDTQDKIVGGQVAGMDLDDAATRLVNMNESIKAIVKDKKGGNVLTDLAVPVSMIALREVYKRRRSAKGGKSSKRKVKRNSTKRRKD
jgi:hypothetical protein